jgi:CO/xanthine dehydrogenase Mo-binding subunit
MSMHQAGHMGYHEGEAPFRTEHGTVYSADVEMDPTGRVILRSALPDSGTNHDTGMATVIAEMLGISSIDDIKLLWGDSDVAPPSDQWYGALTVTVQGGAALVAAKKLKAELVARAAGKLGVDASTLTLKDGVIRSKADPQISVAAAELLDGKSLRMHGETKLTGHGRALVKGIGACFVEVEVDTWTGQFRVTRVVYSHDTGKLVNPLIAVADMEGSFMQSFQIATNAIPYDKEFPGQMHNSRRSCRFRSRPSWNSPRRSSRYSSKVSSRAGSTVTRASARPASAGSRAQLPMPSTMRLGCASAIPSRPRAS